MSLSPTTVAPFTAQLIISIFRQCLLIPYFFPSQLAVLLRSVLHVPMLNDKTQVHSTISFKHFFLLILDYSTVLQNLGFRSQ